MAAPRQPAAFLGHERRRNRRGRERGHHGLPARQAPTHSRDSVVMSTEVQPLVSVVIPVRNEAGFIADLVGAVFAQDYPADRLEVIVADGQSTDGTREILAGLQERHPLLTVLDNPGRIVPTGLNLAIARARGDVIVRIDGHAVISPDFLRQNVALLSE